MGTGKLIVIEGACEGIGKTTQFRLLREQLKKENIKYTDHHFPTYYAYQGKGAEKYLAGEFGKPEELSPYFINNLYAYDRAITWRIKLESEFEKGRMVILDRYTTSSMIYQTALFSNQLDKQKFLDYIIDFEYQKLGIKQPDLVIFLNAPYDLVVKLHQQHREKHHKGDIHEQDAEDLRKIYDNAQFVADYLKWAKIECADATGAALLPPEVIHQQVWQKVRAVIQQN